MEQYIKYLNKKRQVGKANNDFKKSLESCKRKSEEILEKLSNDLQAVMEDDIMKIFSSHRDSETILEKFRIVKLMSNYFNDERFSGQIQVVRAKENLNELKYLFREYCNKLEVKISDIDVVNDDKINEQLRIIDLIKASEKLSFEDVKSFFDELLLCDDESVNVNKIIMDIGITLIDKLNSSAKDGVTDLDDELDKEDKNTIRYYQGLVRAIVQLLGEEKLRRKYTSEELVVINSEIREYGYVIDLDDELIQELWKFDNLNKKEVDKVRELIYKLDKIIYEKKNFSYEYVSPSLTPVEESLLSYYDKIIMTIIECAGEEELRRKYTSEELVVLNSELREYKLDIVLTNEFVEALWLFKNTSKEDINKFKESLYKVSRTLKRVGYQKADIVIDDQDLLTKEDMDTIRHYERIIGIICECTGEENLKKYTDSEILMINSEIVHYKGNLVVTNELIDGLMELNRAVKNNDAIKMLEWIKKLDTMFYNMGKREDENGKVTFVQDEIISEYEEEKVGRRRNG